MIIFKVLYPPDVAHCTGPFVYVKTIVLPQLPAVTCSGLTTTLPSPTHCVAVGVGVGVFVGVTVITFRQDPQPLEETANPLLASNPSAFPKKHK